MQEYVSNKLINSLNSQWMIFSEPKFHNCGTQWQTIKEISFMIADLTLSSYLNFCRRIVIENRLFLKSQFPF